MLAYITADPNILGGKPCVKDTRLSVEFILELFASGASHSDILQTYPQLSVSALNEVLEYTVSALKNDIVLTTEVAV